MSTETLESSERKRTERRGFYAVVAISQNVLSVFVLLRLSSGLGSLLRFRPELTTSAVQNFERWAGTVACAAAVGFMALGVMLWIKRPQSLAVYAIVTGLLWWAVFVYVAFILFYQAGSIMVP